MHCCARSAALGPLFLHASRHQEPGSVFFFLLQIHNNKHPAKDVLNNGFIQKPKTTPSKSKYLLSPSVAGTWEEGLCAEQSEEGNHSFWRRQCEHLNKKWLPGPTVYFTSQFPHRFMKAAQKRSRKQKQTCFFFRCKEKKNDGEFLISGSEKQTVSLYVIIVSRTLCTSSSTFCTHMQFSFRLSKSRESGIEFNFTRRSVTKETRLVLELLLYVT